MSPQASTAVTTHDDERAAECDRKAYPAASLQKPTLYVVSLPDASRGADVDPAERDRQASLDLLHRLVMG